MHRGRSVRIHCKCRLISPTPRSRCRHRSRARWPADRADLRRAPRHGNARDPDHRGRSAGQRRSPRRRLPHRRLPHELARAHPAHAAFGRSPGAGVRGARQPRSLGRRARRAQGHRVTRLHRAAERAYAGDAPRPRALDRRRGRRPLGPRRRAARFSRSSDHRHAPDCSPTRRPPPTGCPRTWSAAAATPTAGNSTCRSRRASSSDSQASPM